ncbi:MAG: TetR/AcrR family transcriptional regulator [Proteobacteria bacterium]|nr:TetR/AcrR family transcriptional regulator [Pseudomonadota bacterium]
MTQLTDAKRDAILEAASRMFLAEGYSAVSMDAIAVAAPVSKPTLYNYFPGKQALFSAVVERDCERLALAVDSAVTDDGDLRSDLQTIARAYVDIVYEPRCLALYRVIIAELKHFPDLGKLTYESGAIPIIAAISRYLRGAGSRAGVRFPHVERSTRLLISMLTGDEFHRCLLGLSPTLSARQRALLVSRVVDNFLKAHGNDA